ncbi:capsule biosynthesis GfcC family protein [Stenotrophomonas lactitubi]|uniref:capsule biosynthesis GfcC family protein n=1 Tax=Stenotrophomonas lactitubi TaxID=2045214 RepID=UPI00320ADC42
MTVRSTLLALALALSFHAHASSPIGVETAGHVRNPGAHTLPAGARLSAAALAAAPDAEAYMLGAALLRQRSLLPQTRLKAGLLFDLETLASQEDAPELADAAAQLARELGDLPVTGRESQLLDPRRLEASSAENRPSLEGDRLVYPGRPDTVQVVGAVVQPCRLKHQFTLDAQSYRSACPILPAASRDDLYIIQPDGKVEQLGVALWNRSAPMHLAPGAVIYVPLSATKIRAIAPDVNEDAVRFLATQVLDAPGVSY